MAAGRDRRAGTWARRYLGRVLIALVVLAWPASGGAQLRVSSEERFFRIEWQLERDADRSAVVGIVGNRYLSPVQRVQLQVQVVDETGQVVHEALAPVGDVPAGARNSFRLELPTAGSRVVVTVHSFEFAAAQSP